jgi:hypothetical protein
MLETFQPRQASASPMYYENPDSPVWNYSPLPERYYVHINNTGLSLYPLSNILRRRDQAGWNLLWLTTPIVDEALRIHNQETFDAFLDRTRPWLMHRYGVVRKLVNETVKWGGRINKVGAVSKAIHPQEFTEFMLRHPRFVTALNLSLGKDTAEIMEHRARVRDRIALENLNLPKAHPERILPQRDYNKLIAHTEKRRTQWLLKATQQLRSYIKKHRQHLPEVNVRLDKFTFQRLGVCDYNVLVKQTGKKFNYESEIGISPMKIDSNAVLKTLVHELGHVICGPYVGHRAEFYQTLETLGLEQEKREKPNAELLEQFAQIQETLGPYPGHQIHVRIP